MRSTSSRPLLRLSLFVFVGLGFSACDASLSPPVASGGTLSESGGNVSSGGGSTRESGGSVSSAGATPESGGTVTNGTGGTLPASGGRAGSGGTHSGGTTSIGGQFGGTGGAELGGEGVTGGGGNGPGAGGHPGTGQGDIVMQGVRWIGRVSPDEPARFAWSGTGFVARFSGTSLTVRLMNTEGYLFQLVLDGTRQEAFLAKRGEAAFTLASNLPPGEHIVELYRQTEGRYGESQLKSIEVEGGELLAPPLGPNAVLEIIGDSISAGYGNLGADASCSFSFDTESHFDSYGSVAGRALGVDVHTIAFSGHGLILNNDGTTTDLLPDLYDRTLTKDPALVWTHAVEPEVIVVNLGTNDFAKGNPGTVFEDAYLTFLRRLREAHPGAFVLATLGPMMKGSNLSAARTYIQHAVQAFEAEGNEGKVGFLEYPVQDSDELGCHSHPNVAKHGTMADALVSRVRELGIFASSN